MVLRVELREGEPSLVRELANELIMENPHIAYLVAAKHIPPPEIVILSPGELLGGRFKVPVYVDETCQAPTPETAKPCTGLDRPGRSAR